MTNRIIILKVWVNITTSIDYFLLFNITSAAIHPGIQPRSVRIKVITIFPHPWSYTANGGNTMHNKTLKQLISSTLKIKLEFSICYMIDFIT
jgi:hypothetical protein